jgi:hypothetical protein
MEMVFERRVSCGEESKRRQCCFSCGTRRKDWKISCKVDVRMCGCADVRMCGCADVQMCRCANVRMCECADVQMCG